jgi:hypothetical protein
VIPFGFEPKTFPTLVGMLYPAELFTFLWIETLNVIPPGFELRTIPTLVGMLNLAQVAAKYSQWSDFHQPGFFIDLGCALQFLKW